MARKSNIEIKSRDTSPKAIITRTTTTNIPLVNNFEANPLFSKQPRQQSHGHISLAISRFNNDAKKHDSRIQTMQPTHNW